MEKSIEKIKQALEQKRKHNFELLNNLKEKSIILNAEKEKQKRFFLNKTSTFLNKKRKKSDPIDINDISAKNNDNSYELINKYEDYDDYYDDFMNNSFMSNKIFNNLNFCRPERFSLYKNKKKKLSIKNEEEFTIKKTIKPKEISSRINISFESKVKNTNDNNNLGFIAEKKNNETKKNDKELSFFDINKESNNNKSTPQGLFGTNTPGNNETSLFSSNINDKDKEKNINNNNKKEEKKEQINLFGNIDRLNSIENKDKTLFGETNLFNKEKISTPKKEENKEKKETIKPTNLGLFDTTPTPEGETKKEEGKSIFNKDNKMSLFDNKEKKEEKVEKEKITLPKLTLKEEEKKEEKNEIKIDKENKEVKNTLFGNSSLFSNNTDKDNNNNENKSPLFSGSLFGNNNTNTNISLFDKKEENINEKKEEKKETINFGLFNNNMQSSTNTSTSLFNNNENKVNNISEQPKLNISIADAAGSLAKKGNPFLNPGSNTQLPTVFRVKDLSNNNNNSLFNNNEQQNSGLFNNGFMNNQGMNPGNMSVSPQFGARSIFNDNNQNNGPSLFGSNNNGSIFGNNNNTQSLFNFPQNSGIGSGQGIFSNGSGFSLGKK